MVSDRGARWRLLGPQRLQDRYHLTHSNVLPMGENASLLNDISAAAGGGQPGDVAIIQAILADLDATFPRALGQASTQYLEGIVQNWGLEPYTRGCIPTQK